MPASSSLARRARPASILDGVNVDWSHIGMILICDRCALVIQAGDLVAADDICPGESA